MKKKLEFIPLKSFLMQNGKDVSEADFLKGERSRPRSKRWEGALVR